MQQLKAEIEEASRAVEAEREQNVEILNLIFPPQIARRLWLSR